MAQNKIVFILDDHVFTSTNAGRLESLPDTSQVFEDAFLRETRVRRWFSPSNLILPYIPLRIQWDSPLLQRFAVTRNSLPLEGGNGRSYRLASALLAQWTEFENMLDVIQAVLFSGPPRGILLPLDMLHLKRPEDWGYKRSHRRESTARTCAMNARNAFIHMMAATTFLITFNVGPHIDTPQWYELLETQAHIRPDIIHQIKTSVIGDLSDAVPRVGTVVDAHTVDQDAWYVANMHIASVPVWIKWGHVSAWNKPVTQKFSPSEILRRLFPTNEQVAEAIRLRDFGPPPSSLGWSEVRTPNVRWDTSAVTWNGSDPAWGDPASTSTWGDAASTSTWGEPTSASTWGEPTSASTWDEPTSASTWGNPTSASASGDPLYTWDGVWGPPTSSTPPPTTPPLFPQPAPGSRQRYGETWQEFFAREDRRHAAIVARETPQEQQTRLSRIRAQENHPVPGRRGPRVFEWVENEDFGGFLTRISVDRGAVDNVWDMWAPSQMRYNPFENEWDLCKQFDPNALSEFETEDEHHDPEEVRAIYGPWEEGEVSSSRAHLFRPVDEVIALEPPQQWRQGFSLGLPDSSHSPEAAPCFAEPLTTILFHRYGFDWDVSDHGGHGLEPTAEMWRKDGANVVQDNTAEVLREYKTPIIQFIQTLLETPFVIYLPHLYWDLSPVSWTPLREQLDHYFVIRRHELEGRFVYSLAPKPDSEENGSWILTTRSSATVLQCVRAGTSILAAARHLAERGIPFNTFLLRATLKAQASPRVAVPPHLPLPPHHRAGLGERREGYEPGTADYESYEAARDDFLRRPKARVALLRGGIVWRLVMEFLQIGSVLVGPSDDALKHGQSLRMDGLDYVDDDLTSDELDLICGVYQVQTGIGSFATPVRVLIDISRVWKAGVASLVVA
jgi:hypothetical protein